MKTCFKHKMFVGADCGNKPNAKLTLRHTHHPTHILLQRFKETKILYLETSKTEVKVNRIKLPKY